MRHGNTRSLSGIEGLHSGPPTAHVGERANEEPLGRVSGPQTRKGGDNGEIRERGCAVTNPSSTGEVCIEDLAELADHVFVALDCSTVWGLRPVAPFMAYSLCRLPTASVRCGPHQESQWLTSARTRVFAR